MTTNLENSTIKYVNGSTDVGYFTELALYWPRVVAKRIELAQDGESLNNPYLFATPSGELRFSATDGFSYHIDLSDPQP